MSRRGTAHPTRIMTWVWHEPVASGHRKVRRCHAGTGATTPGGGEFSTTRNQRGTQLTSATPSFSRIAPTNRANSAASLARDGSAPQTGFGHSGLVLQRATMWMCSCGTTLPSAATLILSHCVTFFERQRGERDLGHQREGVVAEVGELGDAQAPRHQDLPRIVGCVDRQHARERELANASASSAWC